MNKKNVENATFVKTENSIFSNYNGKKRKEN